MSTTRSNNEMLFLYGTSAAYGVGTGVWVDSLFKITDPGLAILAPLGFGVAAPVGAFLWDRQAGPLGRGVPSSVAAGLLVGALTGAGIAGMQYELSDPGKEWPFRTQTTLAFLGATGGGIGGYFFGEYARPDPRQLSLIASGGLWGGLSGVAIGAGVTGTNADWKDGGVVVGFVGFAGGVAGTGALSLFAMPSYETQKWMWIGYGSGLAAGALVFPFYLFSDSDPKHGFVAVGAGGIAGATLAGVLAAHLNDNDDGWTNVAFGKKKKNAYFSPPFNLGLMPNAQGGAQLSASGTW